MRPVLEMRMRNHICPCLYRPVCEFVLLRDSMVGVNGRLGQQFHSQPNPSPDTKRGLGFPWFDGVPPAVGLRPRTRT